MNMDAISILTDAVGGVKVNVTDDFSAIDGSLKNGEIILNGDQAYKFLRTRKDVGDQLNLSRMDRHKEFMAGFEEAYRKNIGDSISMAMEIYNDISPYVVTDCSDNTIANLLNRLYDYKLVDILSPAGTNVRGEEYMEFYIDEEELFQLVLRLLYEPKNSNS
jgi:anionic cell wall polymer biosynthesis LytR-Cps2A-Psr (LCP) family protein